MRFIFSNGTAEGTLSIAFSALFWLPLALAFLHLPPFFSVPLAFVFISWAGAFVLAVEAGLNGSRCWFLACVPPVAAVLVFIHMIQG